MEFKRSATIALAVMAIALLSSCAPKAPAAGGTPTEQAPLSAVWWAAGDSVFAGVGAYNLGAPAHLSGVSNVSVAGNVLVGISILGNKQPTVMNQLQNTIARNGGEVPENIILHAGGADMFARVQWAGADVTDRPGAKVAHLTVDDYTAEMQYITTYLENFGVTVWWTTIIPSTVWSPEAQVNTMRTSINDWMRANFGEHLIDCESAMTQPGTPWLNPTFNLSVIDGVHLNAKGAVAHANCIAAATGLQVDATTPSPSTTEAEPAF